MSAPNVVRTEHVADHARMVAAILILLERHARAADSETPESPARQANDSSVRKDSANDPPP